MFEKMSHCSKKNHLVPTSLFKLLNEMILINIIVLYYDSVLSIEVV